MLGRELEGKETQAVPRLCLNLELIGCLCCEDHRKWEEEEVIGQVFTALWASVSHLFTVAQSFSFN